MPPVNDSTTGGYLLPASTPAPLEGQALLRFFQQMILGITGIPGILRPGDNIRPYWQEEPPTIPDQGQAWIAFKISTRPSDEFPFVGRLPNLPEDGSDHMQRHEELTILTSFYDTGSTGLDNANQLADYYCALLRDGLLVPQNREPLFINKMGLVRTGIPTTVPVLLKQRWKYGVDLEWVVRREIDRSYPVRTIVGATGTLYTNTGLPGQPFSAGDTED